MNSVRYYGLSYNNPQRKQRLQEQFTKENLHIDIYDGVPLTDSRITCVAPGEKCNRRAWSCMWGHLDMIRQFLDTTAEFGIFCEDDIVIRKGFAKFIPEVVSTFSRLGLDILLLGYLIPLKPISFKNNAGYLSLIEEPISYYRYDDQIYGTQMYMLNRSTAKRFLDTYTKEYALRTLKNTSLTAFCADMTLTKNGNRALLYPMLAIEKVEINKPENVHEVFHKKCYEIQKHKRYYFLETEI
jgi:GR25 family glycosyltransferase involved in LPS biosynthesis